MLQPKVVVGDFKHIYFIVFNIIFILYANPVLSQVVGELIFFFVVSISIIDFWLFFALCESVSHNATWHILERTGLFA